VGGCKDRIVTGKRGGGGMCCCPWCGCGCEWGCPSRLMSGGREALERPPDNLLDGCRGGGVPSRPRLLWRPSRRDIPTAAGQGRAGAGAEELPRRVLRREGGRERQSNSACSAAGSNSPTAAPGHPPPTSPASAPPSPRPRLRRCRVSRCMIYPASRSPLSCLTRLSPGLHPPTAAPVCSRQMDRIPRPPSSPSL
jgi:hypothetical protein